MKLCSLDHSVSPFVFTFPHPQGSFLIQLLLLLYTHFPLGFVQFNKLLLCMNYMPDTVLGTLCAEKTCEVENYDQFG